MIKLKEIRIKYLRKRRNGKEESFYSKRKIGQVIKEDAFEGLVDKVLDIEGILVGSPKIEKVIKLLQDIVDGNYPHDFKWIEGACAHYISLLQSSGEKANEM